MSFFCKAKSVSMKTITITCDRCGTTDLKRCTGVYFERSEVEISTKLHGQYVSEIEINEYRPIKLDLCSNCTIALHEEIKNFSISGKSYTVVGTLNVNGLHVKNYKSYSQKTSYYTLQDVCKEVGLGFNSNISDTDDKMTWINVSDLKGFQGSIAKQYKLLKVPTNFLIDASGKIIAKDIHEAILEKTIKDYLNKQ